MFCIRCLWLVEECQKVKGRKEFVICLVSVWHTQCLFCYRDQWDWWVVMYCKWRQMDRGCFHQEVEEQRNGILPVLIPGTRSSAFMIPDQASVTMGSIIAALISLCVAVVHFSIPPLFPDGPCFQSHAVVFFSSLNISTHIITFSSQVSVLWNMQLCILLFISSIVITLWYTLLTIKLKLNRNLYGFGKFPYPFLWLYESWPNWKTLTL